MFDRRERRRSLMTLARAGTGQRRVRVVRAAAVGDSGGDAMRVGRVVGVFTFAVAGVVRRVAGERAGPYLTGPLLGCKQKITVVTHAD